MKLCGKKRKNPFEHQLQETWTSLYPIVYSNSKPSHYFDFGGGGVDYDDNNVANKKYYRKKDPVKSARLFNILHENPKRKSVWHLHNYFFHNSLANTVIVNCERFPSIEEEWPHTIVDSLIKIKKDIKILRQMSFWKNIAHLYLSLSQPYRKLVYKATSVQRHNDDDVYDRLTNQDALYLLAVLQHKKFRYYWQLKQQKK